MVNVLKMDSTISPAPVKMDLLAGFAQNVGVLLVAFFDSFFNGFDDMVVIDCSFSVSGKKLR